MSRTICLLLCVLCACVAVTQGAYRFRRAGGASSSSSSSSSSGSFAGAGGVGGPGNGGFAFPTHNNFGFGAPFGNFGAPPFQDFNILFQQFLASLQAAQAYAAANPSYAPIFHQQFASLMSQQQAAMAQFPTLFQGGVDSNTITPDLRTGGGGAGGNPGAPGAVFTGASVNYGPQGGFGQAASYPGGASGLGVRIAEELPPPNGGGGGFGVFTSSSSGTSDVNGKRTSFKTSTFGTNDNGKITFRTINE